MSSRVITEVTEGVLYIRLNGPRPHNPLTLKMLQEIGEVLDSAARDPRVAVALMYGHSDLFPAGLDMLEAFGISNETASAVGYLPSVNAWLDFPKPTVCAVEGAVKNVALSFVEASDICIAGEKATFQHDELRIGLLPCAGSTQLLPRLVSTKVAAGMLFGGWPLGAAEALRHGLISRVVPEGTAFAEASAVAESLATLSRPMVGELKRLVRTSFERRLSDGIGEEARAFPRTFALEDRTEGTGAALQERAPNFKHR